MSDVRASSKVTYKLITIIFVQQNNERNHKMRISTLLSNINPSLILYNLERPFHIPSKSDTTDQIWHFGPNLTSRPIYDISCLTFRPISDTSAQIWHLGSNLTTRLKSDISAHIWHLGPNQTFRLKSDISAQIWQLGSNLTFQPKSDISAQIWHFGSYLTAQSSLVSSMLLWSVGLKPKVEDKCYATTIIIFCDLPYKEGTVSFVDGINIKLLCWYKKHIFKIFFNLNVTT